MSQPIKKVILKVDVHDETAKQNAMKSISDFPGVDSISINMKAQELTLIGNMDPVGVVKKLSGLCKAEISFVLPAEEAEKKKKKKKEEPESSSKKKEEETKKDDVAKLVSAYQAYNPYTSQV
ncbi:heavy metal-associated isoprenylated plant protein 39-like [Corylus avellana]|uniref:heavy metal-associated isoprenylated plant protein 39-like n=1 Tax=Corylus avellana TaxID=13451 RepID=UPI001E21C101|nr:heavy metal-associated isoprenylated plant protein 39-like [Corylus avellana]